MFNPGGSPHDVIHVGLHNVQGLAVWRGAQARCDFAEALRFPAVLQCGAQQILQILLPSDGLLKKGGVRNCRSQSKYLQ
jgi:hypothetical protein